VVVYTGHEAVVEHQEAGRGGCVVLGRVVIFRGWDYKRVVVEETEAVVLRIKIQFRYRRVRRVVIRAVIRRGGGEVRARWSQVERVEGRVIGREIEIVWKEAGGAETDTAVEI
jgi:hypothetical protein